LSGFALPGYFVAIGQLHQQIFRKSVSPFLVWLIVDGIVEVFLSGLSGRNYQHYFICWLPAIASSTAILIYFVFPSLCEWSERNFSGFLLASVGLALLLNSNVFDNYLQSARLLLARPAGVVQKSDQIAEYINENTAPADLVLIWGGRVGINFLSKRDAPTAYIFYPLFVPSKVTERISASYYQQIHENPPVLIVDGSYLVADGVIPLSVIDPIKWAEGHGLYAPPYLDEVFEFVHENYSIKTTINGVPIYKKIQ
jgi:hypothetical protein